MSRICARSSISFWREVPSTYGMSEVYPRRLRLPPLVSSMSQCISWRCCLSIHGEAHSWLPDHDNVQKIPTRLSIFCPSKGHAYVAIKMLSIYRKMPTWLSNICRCKENASLLALICRLTRRPPLLQLSPSHLRAAAR